MPTRLHIAGVGRVAGREPLAKKKTDNKKVKLGAAATVLGVLIAGCGAARAASSDTIESLMWVVR